MDTSPWRFLSKVSMHSNHIHVLNKRRDHLVAFRYTGEQSLAVLRIAHQYRMQTFEERIISRLKEGNTGFPWIYLLLASQIVDLEGLYEQAVKSLSSYSIAMLSLAEAERVGISAFYDITTRRMAHRSSLESETMEGSRSEFVFSVAKSNIPESASSDGDDYSTGPIRRHSKLYLQTGDLVIQVCNKLSIRVEELTCSWR
jgi:hypothetical protein